MYLQGIAWVSADHQVLRLRTDLLHPVTDIRLTRETSEIDYRPYHFLTWPVTCRLPNRVTVSIEWRQKRLRNDHIFSKFHLFKVNTGTQRTGAIGSPLAASAAGAPR